MNKKWLQSILGLSLLLLGILKTYEVRSMATYFKSDRVIKIESFTKARFRVDPKDLELLKLWESMLTGRSAPISKLVKERYQSLGLNHLFTPSGFHLSAAIFPFMKILNVKYHFAFLIVLGFLLCFLPGLTAMKRMLVIKTTQKLLGMHLGFACALIIDMFFGSFQSGALSFTYSFLFLGIIYSGAEGVVLIIWFFIAQIILSYFQNSDISLLLLFFSPLLNLGFGLVMPVLFLLSFPLWDWQLHLGINLLKFLQYLVDASFNISFRIPALEVQLITLLMITLLMVGRRQWFLICLCLMSSGLNLDREKNPGLQSNEYVSQGAIVQSIYSEKEVKVYFVDGSCKMKLVRGYWFENCSPKRRSSRIKKLKKLSYPS
jgi:hypothetical protein